MARGRWHERVGEAITLLILNGGQYTWGYRRLNEFKGIALVDSIIVKPRLSDTRFK